MGFADALNAKLNFDDVDCAAGPAGGALLVRWVSLSPVFSGGVVSSTCKSFEGRKGFSLSAAASPTSDLLLCAGVVDCWEFTSSV